MEYILIIASKRDCGRCFFTKGDGKLYTNTDKFTFYTGPKNDDRQQVKRKWNPDMFKKLMCGTNGKYQRVKIQELIFNSSDPSQDNLCEVVDYELAHPTRKEDADDIIQTIYSDKNPESSDDTSSKSNITYKTVHTKNSTITTKIRLPFNEALSNKVPMTLRVFTYLYPTWLIVDMKSWEAALKSPVVGPMRAWAMGYHHVSIMKGIWALDFAKGKEYVQQDPVECVDRVLENPKFLHNMPPDPDPINKQGVGDSNISTKFKDATHESFVPFTNGLGYRVVPMELIVLDDGL